jgi:hypothetical protein
MDDPPSPLWQLVERWWKPVLMAVLALHQYTHIYGDAVRVVRNHAPYAEKCISDREMYQLNTHACADAIAYYDSWPSLTALIELLSGHWLWHLFLSLLSSWTGTLAAVGAVFVAIRVLVPSARTVLTSALAGLGVIDPMRRERGGGGQGVTIGPDAAVVDLGTFVQSVTERLAGHPHRD